MDSSETPKPPAEPPSLVDLFRGDDRAFERLVAAIWDKSCRFTVRRTFDWQEAENIVQRALLALYRAARRDLPPVFANDRALEAYMRRILRRRINRVMEARLRHPLALHPLDDLLSLLPEPLEDRGGVYGIAELEACVAELGGEEKSLLTWFYDEGLSAAEIAAVLGITEEAVRWRLWSIRRKLFRRMDSRFPTWRPGTADPADAPPPPHPPKEC